VASRSGLTSTWMWAETARGGSCRGWLRQRSDRRCKRDAGRDRPTGAKVSDVALRRPIHIAHSVSWSAACESSSQRGLWPRFAPSSLPARREAAVSLWHSRMRLSIEKAVAWATCSRPSQWLLAAGQRRRSSAAVRMPHGSTAAANESDHAVRYRPRPRSQQDQEQCEPLPVSR
jgi:hypothetical protein